MRIRIKLYAALGKSLPASVVKNEADIEMVEGATPSLSLSVPGAIPPLLSMGFSFRQLSGQPYFG